MAEPWDTSAPLGSAARGRLELPLGVRDATIDADPALDDLFRARFEGRRPAVDVRAGIVTIRRHRRGPQSRHERAAITLNASIPWDIRLAQSAVGLNAELARLELTSVELLGGARDSTLSLPRPVGTVAVDVRHGVARLAIHRPFDVPARVKVTRGANGVTLDEQHFKTIGGVVRWESPRYAEASDRYDILIDGGANQLVVDTLGRQGAAPAERSVATVLFTDIVASTDRARELGDRRWRELLDRHDQAARVLADRFGGRVVKSTGDGILAAFDSPGQAVRAAWAFRAEVRGLGLDIRAGLHTGELVDRGADVGGIAVHIGARVMAVAGPGEVLVSRTVRDLIAGSDIRLVARASQELKGLGDDEWELFAVVGVGPAGGS